MSQIIDTGRSLGNDTKVQTGLPSQAQSADISLPIETMNEVSQNADIVVSPNPEVLGTSTVQERQTYFTINDGLVEAYKTEAGQVYLSIDLLPVLIILVLLITALFLWIGVIFLRGRKSSRKHSSPLLSASPARHKVRRLTL